MKVWAAVTWLASCFTLSPVDPDGLQEQVPDSLDLKAPPSRISGRPGYVVAPAVSNDLATIDDDPLALPPGPIFKPPTGLTGRTHWGGSNFECDYTAMKGYESCSTDNNRGCWLRNAEGHEYNILSNYEDNSTVGTPIGVTRDYTLVVEDGVINTDGLWSKDAKLVNGSYPGPWIQACWGDWVRIKVINKLKHNGTAIHLHGIRQWKSMQADGVPGITQCPIAPNDYFVYEFRALQYGSSWYHSHYSVQYADGLLGPITLHGPTSSNWNEPKSPILMTDWFHNSAFSVIHEKVPGYTTALLNGTGDVTASDYDETYDNGTIKKDHRFNIEPNAPVPAKYTLNFEKGKRYLLRLINTSFGTNFIFSIDHHRMTIVGADFVPVDASEPRTHIQIGIGQRYTVIVEANPERYGNNPREWDEKHPNFWIRTIALKCFKDSIYQFPESATTGILRYDSSDVRAPITNQWDIVDVTTCKDEIGLKPTLRWKVEKPRNGNKLFGEELSVGFTPEFLAKKGRKYPLATWSFGHDEKNEGTHALQIDYDNPFFLNLHNDTIDWPEKWVVIPEDYKDDDWVFFAITQRSMRRKDKPGPGPAHPIHLHGHDFAIVRYEPREPFDPNNTALFAPEKMQFDNPMRRDVVLLPRQGWFIMAFKTDNPGSWIMHCHIAFHASEGLALQINERQKAANALWPNPQNNHQGPFDPAIRESQRVCKRWKDFHHDCTQHWPGKNETANCWPACSSKIPKERPYSCGDNSTILPGHVFQDDSGI